MIAASCAECGAEFLKRVKPGNQPRFCSEVCRTTNQTRYRQAWVRHNRERVLRKMADRRKRFAEKNPQYWREFYAANRERRMEARREFYKQNKERSLEACRKYDENNRERVRAIGRKSRQTRRARILSVFVEVVDPRVVFERDEGTCGICRQPVVDKRWEVDHVIALANGGSHSYTNVQLAHLSCNRSKGAKVAS